jgi:leukotriene A-4 hydrolase/aminopeptidase
MPHTKLPSAQRHSSCRSLVLSFLLALVPVATLPAATAKKDHHSFANPEHIRVGHVDLDLNVDFERKALAGHATLSVERTSGDVKQPLLLDSRALRVKKVEWSSDGRSFTEGSFSAGKTDPILGEKLSVPLPADVKRVRLHYSTGPRASALQWLDREQTGGKRHPFLFTQSQAIHARSWIPLQDSPGVRVTYTAHLRTPKGLLAVMSANNDPKKSRDGEYRFEMKRAIPPYLIALAVGDLAFRPVGPRTGVYAEPGVVDKAATEFADMEKMVQATEELYGPYRWGRYDLLVLPPSFPFGGMENPCLTFASPTVLAGDKSLVSLVAHELSHSWSGNLVSNATWRDFWLNEGFTVYLERRILEKVYGKARAEMEAVLGRRSLERELAELKPQDQVLHIDLKGRDPEDGLTDVPYEKGALFLTHLERSVGRARFDAFLKGYFDHFAFRSITTADFVAYLDTHLIKGDRKLAEKLSVQEWISKPGIPGRAPTLTAEALTRAEAQAKRWLSGKGAAKSLTTSNWSTQEWLHFLQALPEKLGRERLKELDEAFEFSRSGNSEITFQWLMMAVRNGYEPALPRLEQFLASMGRRKFLQPLYTELVKTPQGKERALRIYRKARPTYHPIAIATVDAIVGWKD